MEPHTPIDEETARLCDPCRDDPLPLALKFHMPWHPPEVLVFTAQDLVSVVVGGGGGSPWRQGWGLPMVGS